MTSEAREIMKKLKDKKAEYGRVRIQGSSVNPTQYFGSSSQQYMPSGSQAQVKVQKLKDQMAQMQASIGEQIAQLKAEATSFKEKVAAREAGQNSKYNELQLQLQNMMQMFQQFQKPPS
ncbi:Glucose-6-phosphate isomerase [Gossypium arboreum]|uniref:Glucose-6-phosphate isomerase n=1 Tax=Gossypium arboreum TaxID=29729 RepID=A0A0B0MZU0_GOSAR|nr:Glucose-6-phosphate isomerase [Gossypium arboreum]